MLQGTRIVQIYMRTQGPADARFGNEIDDDAVNDYAYDGWLPLALTPRNNDGRQQVASIGDPWLTTPGEADAPPDPGPAPVRITAVECSAELEARGRVGLRYFTEETPEERSEPYDRDRIMEDIAEEIREKLGEAQELDAAHASLCGIVHRIDHVEVTLAAITRVHADTGITDQGEINKAAHRMIGGFVAERHQELVAYAEQRRREGRARLRAIMQAGQRLGAFDD